MDIHLIYAVVVGSFFGLFVIRHAHQLMINFLWSRQVFAFLYRHLYPVLVKRNRVLPAFTRLYVLLQTLYWAGTIVYNVVGISGVAEGSTRAGTLALVNLIPLLFSDRLSFAADILSLSHRTYLQIHKAMGVMAVLQLTAHIVLESINGSFVLSRAKDTYGLLAVSALGATAIIALPILRKYMYEVFLKVHYALSAVVVYALWRRFEASRYERILLMVAVSIHAALTLLRMGRVVYRNTMRESPWSRAKITKGVEAFEVTLSVPRPFHCKPNQYIYLCVPGLTPGSWLEWHPFSVSWWSCNDAGQATSLSLLVKPQHGFTQRLMRCASTKQEFYVAIDGPYGEGIDTSQYGTLILLATGIGIAAQMPLIKQALADYKASRTSVRKICVIWQIDQESDEEWAEDWINTMLKEEDDAKVLHCKLFVLGGFKEESSKIGDRKIYGHRVKKTYGPANLSRLIAAEMEEEALVEMRETVPAEETNARRRGSSHHVGYASGRGSSVYATDTADGEKTWVVTPDSETFKSEKTLVGNLDSETFKGKETLLGNPKSKAVAVKVKESTEAPQCKKREKGRILISVSADALFRDKICDLGRHLVGDDVEIMELDFQPFNERHLWRAKEKLTGQGGSLA